MSNSVPNANPSVSVVIPAYGCARTIAAVLDAVLAQTVQPLQVIVVNDRSPDSLDEAVKPYLDRIEYVTNPRNFGLAKTCNEGLRRTKAPVVMTLHSDCILDSDYIEKLLRHLDSDPNLGAATGQYLFENYESLALSDRLFASLNLLPVETDRSDRSVHYLSFIEGKADVFRREAIEQFGFFSENLTLTAEDQDLSAKMRQKGYKILQDASCRFRVMFTGTSDSLWKVLRKQRTYARGQTYVVIRYGLGILGDTTPNRKFRARHRFGQLLFAAVLPLTMIAPLLNPFLWWLPLAWIGLRMITYGFLAHRFARSDVLLTALLGPVADVLYFAGAIEGTVKTLLFKKT